MEFKTVSFLDLLDNIVDNRGKTCPSSDDGLALIATNCIKNDSLTPVFEKIRYVSKNTYENWFRAHPLPDDIIFVCKGSPGRVAWTPDPVNFCIAQDMVAIRAKQEIIYPKFLFALLRSNKVQAQIANMHVGTLIPHFKKGDFSKLNLKIPVNYEYQKFIGDWYYMLSKKIELNKKINQTLESIAQTIFKSWFVDFDPVHAKANAQSIKEYDAIAKELGISREILDLFPSEFEESEHGLIPKGWFYTTLEADFNIVMGQSPSGSTYNEEKNGVPFFQGNADFGFRFPSNRVYCTEPKRFAKARQTLISVRAPVGAINMAYEDCSIGRGLCAVSYKKNSDSYTYYSMLNLKSYLKNFEDNGTVFGSINKKSFNDIPYLKPDVTIITAFEKIIENIDHMIFLNSSNENTTKKLRDLLLPKLLSGEIDVSNLYWEAEHD